MLLQSANTSMITGLIILWLVSLILLTATFMQSASSCKGAKQIIMHMLAQMYQDSAATVIIVLTILFTIIHFIII